MLDEHAIAKTEFSFSGQTALYHGKVRDVYTLSNATIISIATDRISAFDVILPRAVPFKGQVLNQLAAYFLQATSDIVPNWLQATPDPNVSIGTKAEPVKIEMVIRGSLVGHAWREYQQGKRELCGVTLPEGLKEYDAFAEPIITPSTKADEGHDEDISATDIIKTGLATQDEWETLATYTKQLFARGQQMARERGLVLADTKYEFGTVDGKIILIDEIHTPDSSRYFFAESYDAYTSGVSSDEPRHLSKEFVREWLMEHGFNGQAGQTVPVMDDGFVAQITDRYIELYELMSGRSFDKSESADPLQRIKTNIETYLAQ